MNPLRRCAIWVLEAIMPLAEAHDRASRRSWAKRRVTSNPEVRVWMFDDWVPNGEEALSRCPSRVTELAMRAAVRKRFLPGCSGYGG
jgi:hypothetical protein